MPPPSGRRKHYSLGFAQSDKLPSPSSLGAVRYLGPENFSSNPRAENPDDYGVPLNGGDELEPAAAAWAVFDVDLEGAPLGNDEIGSGPAIA